MTTYLIGEAMTEAPSLDLVAIADRYRRALDAKPSKGDISPDGIAAITDSVADVPDLIAELLLTTRLEHEHTWLGPWVGVAGNRIYTCAEAGCVAVRSEGGPDQPEPVKPSREAVRQAIEAAFGPTWDSAVEQGLDAAADAVLALIPAIPGQNPAELAAHDAQVAGRALRRAYIELRTELDHFPLHGRHTRAAWAAQRLLTYADRAVIRAEAQR